MDQNDLNQTEEQQPDISSPIDQDITKELLSVKTILKEIWTHFPIWFLFLEGIGILNMYMSNVPDAWFVQVGIDRTWFALLQLPLSLWFYAYYVVRMRRTELIFSKAKIHLAVLAVAFVLPVLIWGWYTLLPFFRFPLTAHSLHRLFEISNLLWAVVMVIHVLIYGGISRFVTFFVVAFAYGMMLENSGIYLGFFFEPNYWVYLWKFPAPLATMVGWCIVIYCCITLIEYFREHSALIQRSAWLPALMTTILAISADAQLDPLASFPGMWWHWNELLPPFWFGVPFCNYAAWFGAFFAFSYAYFKIFHGGDRTIWQKIWHLAYMIPSVVFFAGIIWLVMMMIFETIVPQGSISYPTLAVLQQTGEKLWPY